jgi:hypothetical protein
VVILYVDDIQYFGESLNNIFDIERQLEQIFKITNTGNVIFYLGMNIYYNKEIGIYHLNQSKYIEQMLKLYHYTDIKTASTPMRIDAKLTKEIENQATKQKIADYSARIGLLNFLIIIYRPNISYAILILNQFMQNLNESH